MSFSYDYPRPMVTVDAMLITIEHGSLETLLIKRKHGPFTGNFALPGGFLEMDENPLAGVARELEEETGITGIPLYPLFTCGQVGRDPRGRCITMVFGALIRKDGLSPKGGDDASEAGWKPLFSPPSLAFDHGMLLREAISSLRWQAKTSAIGKDFLQPEFSEMEITELHRIVLADPEAESPVPRGIKLGILNSGRDPDKLKFTRQFSDQPDYVPVVW